MSGGGPTDDKPTVTLHTPNNPDETTSFMNIRVADIQACYTAWLDRGATFLTKPKVYSTEIRSYMRDPDGPGRDRPDHHNVVSGPVATISQFDRLRARASQRRLPSA
jgi:hypothetical protein